MKNMCVHYFVCVYKRNKYLKKARQSFEIIALAADGSNQVVSHAEQRADTHWTYFIA